MKPRVYVLLLLLIIPVQATVLNPLSFGGIKPDAALAALYCIGLLTGPGEAALIGMALGLVQDVGSAGLIGLAGFTRGLIGLLAGVLGRHVLDIASPSNILFIAVFSLAEAVFIALFLQVFQGSVPFFSLLFTRMLPAALYTGILGYLMLRLLAKKSVLAALRRRSLQKE
jgi:rod shape-determining protein MreD